MENKNEDVKERFIWQHIDQNKNIRNYIYIKLKA